MNWLQNVARVAYRLAGTRLQTEASIKPVRYPIPISWDHTTIDQETEILPSH